METVARYLTFPFKPSTSTAIVSDPRSTISPNRKPCSLSGTQTFFPPSIMFYKLKNLANSTWNPAERHHRPSDSLLFFCRVDLGHVEKPHDVIATSSSLAETEAIPIVLINSFSNFWVYFMNWYFKKYITITLVKHNKSYIQP